MRPSSLGPVKRKFDLEEDKGDQYLSPPAKRLNSYTMDRGGLLMAHSNRWAYKFPIDRHVKSIYIIVFCVNSTCFKTLD